MGKIVGIGGVFLGLKGEDQAVRDWYETHLQLDMTPYGTGFIEGDQLVLISFTRGTNETAPFINFRVDNLVEVIDHLQLVGCEITSDITEYSYGKFAQFKDPFGNYIELWEPYKEEYIKMVEDEIKVYKQKKSNN